MHDLQTPAGDAGIYRIHAQPTIVVALDDLQTGTPQFTDVPGAGRVPE